MSLVIKKLMKYGHIEVTGDENDIHIVSDLHIFHKNIIGMCNRPFNSVEEMTSKLIENWNNVVKENDLVFNLGDFCWSGDFRSWVNLFTKLNGKQVFITGNHDCLSSKTRILTKRGLLFYNQLNKSDSVLSFNTETGFCEWQPINDIIIKKSDEIFSMRGRSLEIECTASHRHLTYKPSNKEYIYKTTTEFERSYGNDLKVVLGSKINNKEYNISDDIIKLSAWLMTDGCYSKKRSKKEDIPNHISIYQSKEENIQIIIELLDSFKYEYSVYDRDRVDEDRYIEGKKIKNIKKEKTFRLKSEFTHFICNYLWDNKVLPTWVYDLSFRQLKIFTDTLLKADGSFYNDYRKDTCWQLHGEKNMLEQFQPLFCMCGYRCTLVEDNRGDHKLNINTEYLHNIKCAYRNFEREIYEGIVFCLTTPLSNFFIELNGKCHFTGNCRKVIKKLSEHYRTVDDASDIKVEWYQKIITFRERIEFRHDKNRYVLDHYPIECYSGNRYGVKMIHGHSHERDVAYTPNHYNVSVERNEYRPISLKELNMLLEKQNKYGIKNLKLSDISW